jgi:hypothetical protein
MSWRCGELGRAKLGRGRDAGLLGGGVECGGLLLLGCAGGCWAELGRMGRIGV